jgi:NADH:ubiquinone oxidoreductase subunit
VTSPRTAAEDVPSSWAAWLRRLLSLDPWRSAVAVAEAAAREWSIDALLSDENAIVETAELILADRPL